LVSGEEDLKERIERQDGLLKMTSWLILRSKQLADTANPEDHKNNEKEYFFKSAQNDIICSLFTDERHSGCGCTVENKSDAQFLKS